MKGNNNNVSLDEKKYIYAGLFVVFAIFGVLIGWSVFAKIDTVIIAPGKVVIKTYKKPVEYKDWGTVTKIYVKEGDFVKKGEALLELEKVEQDTNLKITKSEYYNLLAQRDRLLSEKYGYDNIMFSKEFLELDEINLKQQLIKTQSELFNKRREKLKKEIDLLQERENQLVHKIKGLKDLKLLKKYLLSQYQSQLEEEKQLVKEGLSSKDKKIELTEKIGRLKAEIKDIDINILQAELQIQEIKKQKSLKLKEYQTEIASKLEDTLSRISQIKPKMKLSEAKVKKSIIVAPATGQVIGLKIRSKGQVVHPGDVLMYIVPKKDELFIQVKVNPKDRDKIKEGQLVDLQFPSFLSIGANVVEGRVTYVASDTLFDEVTKTEYYETHIQITENGSNQLKRYGFVIIPGMPATAFIKVEEITPFEYIMQPVILMIKSSFTSN